MNRRLVKLTRMPPRHAALRVWQEASRGWTRFVLQRARRGRGLFIGPSVSANEIAAVLSQTIRMLPAIGRWEAGLAFSKDSSELSSAVGKRCRIAMSGEAELFGDDPRTVGDPPQWTQDLLTGACWPMGYAPSIEYAQLNQPSDVKLTWELSRMRGLVALAQASTVLGDEAALAVLGRHLDDWLRCNPVGFGVNWSCAMEVALRAVNLICVDGILSAGDARSPKLRRKLVVSLYEHGWYLNRNLEISTLNGNHFLADAVGLVWLGRYFDGFGESSKWLRRGREMVLQATREQILDDGLDHEGSLPYHLLVLEMFAVALVADRAGLRGVEAAITRMLDATCTFVDAGGRVPNIGDDDGGRVLALSNAPARDARRVLAFAGSLTGHGRAIAVAASAHPEDAAWLLGVTPPKGPESPARRRSEPLHLRSGGVVVMGDGIDHVVVDAGPVGFRGRGGHGHLDAMSMEVTLGGRIAVRDSGTGTYTGDPALRNALRSSDAHNVVMVDGESYANLGETLWALEGDSPPEVRSLESDESGQSVVLRQTLPARGGRAVHHRRLRWRPGSVSWIDRVEAPEGAKVRYFVQLPPGTEREGARLTSGAFEYVIEMPPEASLDLSQAPWSEAYGSVQSGMRATIEATAGASPVEVSWIVRLL